MPASNTATPSSFLRTCTNVLETAEALPQPVAQRVGRWSASFEYKAITTLNTPDGNLFKPSVKIETRREYHELDLIYRVIEATATGPDGLNIGDCSFYTCRRPRNKPEMDPDWIADEMDNISSAVSRMAATLLEVNAFDLDYYVNKSSLVVADRVQVQPAFRGSSFWKELFALCLRHALEPRVLVPDCGYLHAFPLEFEGKVKGNENEFARGTQRLQNLYGRALGARELAMTNLNGCYMTFPIQAPG